MGGPEPAAVLAARQGARETVVRGDGFDHAVWLALDRAARFPDDTLDVYLEGDGRPWATATSVSSDPTPRRALALQLMAEDPGPSVYVARPCYMGHAADPGCTSALWTGARFGGAVVGSMAVAIERIRASAKLQQVRLIGFSGGGVLAVLLAPRIPETISVVTIAADLDLAAWTAYHGYTPLDGSIDPAGTAPLSSRIVQFHLYGSEDAVVPVATAAAYFRRAGNGTALLFPGQGHTCCWIPTWRQFIALLRTGGQMDCSRIGCRLMAAEG